MNMNKYLDIAPEVQQALADGRPVVALESTIISHGMPYPKNVETALLVEQTLRDNGAVPATIAILGGRLKAGLSKEEITYLGKAGRKVAKVSRRDLPVICARGADGATTVTTTMMIAHMAGIRSLPPAASAACTAAPRRPWTSLPTLRSWRRRRSWSCARAQRPSSTSA